MQLSQLSETTFESVLILLFVTYSSKLLTNKGQKAVLIQYTKKKDELITHYEEGKKTVCGPRMMILDRYWLMDK